MRVTNSNRMELLPDREESFLASTHLRKKSPQCYLLRYLVFHVDGLVTLAIGQEMVTLVIKCSNVA